MLIRKLRLKRGWTQDQLAEMAGLSVRTVQRLERGDPASLESARALASVFGVDHSSFRNTDSEEPPMADNLPRASISKDEERALRYAKNVKEFYQGIFVYLVLLVVFFATFGFTEPVVYLVFLGAGIGVVIQGLLAFEVIRLPFSDWEKRLAERKLGRPL